MYLSATRTLLLLELLTISLGDECKRGVPCIFRSRALGWEQYNSSDRATPENRMVPNWKKETTTMYITMSAYRDKLCPGTLFHLFTKASNPHRLRVGVVQQNAPGDIDCLDRYCEMMRGTKTTDSATTVDGCPFKGNINIMRLSASEAKGPTWARSMGSDMMKDEEFCLQMDSHMDFVPEWDLHMLDMWASVDNEYAVLSTYVADSSTLKENLPGAKGTNNVHEVPHLCMVTFGGAHGMVRNWGTKCMRSMPHPKLTNMIWGAGLSFSKCHAERKSPYDPHLPYIFDGEEFSRALRFWTWGYDIYTPHRVYIVHHYKLSQSDPTHSGWGSGAGRGNKIEEVRGAVRRLRILMGLPESHVTPEEIRAVHQGRFGLGDRRSLEQAIAFSGIDTRRKRMVGNRCGNLEYVPFQPHPWGADYIPRYDNTTETFQDVRDPGSIYYDSTSRTMSEAWRKDAQRREPTGAKHMHSEIDRTGFQGHIQPFSVEESTGLLRKGDPSTSTAAALSASATVEYELIIADLELILDMPISSALLAVAIFILFVYLAYQTNALLSRQIRSHAVGAVAKNV